MGASVLKNRLQKEGYKDIKVKNSSASRIDPDADMIITLEGLIERAKLRCRQYRQGISGDQQLSERS